MRHPRAAFIGRFARAGRGAPYRFETCYRHVPDTRGGALTAWHDISNNVGPDPTRIERSGCPQERRRLFCSHSSPPGLLAGHGGGLFFGGSAGWARLPTTAFLNFATRAANALSAIS